uniref:Uncharacterized protein n=1 Tax=Anopheles atroparvus TaxID=41427 RepID=A0A182IZV9_ANOAO
MAVKIWPAVVLQQNAESAFRIHAVNTHQWQQERAAAPEADGGKSVVKQRLQTPITNGGAAQTERVDVLRGERERVHQIKGVLIRRAHQADGVEAAPDERVVQLHPVLVGGLAKLPTLQHRHQAAPVARAPVEQVAPLLAHLRQRAALVGREVQEEARQEPLVLQQLLDGEDLREGELRLARGSAHSRELPAEMVMMVAASMLMVAYLAHRLRRPNIPPPAPPLPPPAPPPEGFDKREGFSGAIPPRPPVPPDCD